MAQPKTGNWYTRVVKPGINACMQYLLGRLIAAIDDLAVLENVSNRRPPLERVCNAERVDYRFWHRSGPKYALALCFQRQNRGIRIDWDDFVLSGCFHEDVQRDERTFVFFGHFVLREGERGDERKTIMPTLGAIFLAGHSDALWFHPEGEAS